VTSPRGLTDAEAKAWAAVAATVARMHPADPATPSSLQGAEERRPGAAPPLAARPARPSPASRPNDSRDAKPAADPGLDSHWDRRFARGLIEPDFTLDLHGHTLDAAHRRLDAGLAQARGMGARVVLLIAGKPRPAQAADRGSSRGAIRAKILDWLAAGPHGPAIAAVRNAHRRHGGEGALYLVLRRANRR
jgi:DNA-nicking Smr family endonuclease